MIKHRANLGYEIQYMCPVCIPISSFARLRHSHIGHMGRLRTTRISFLFLLRCAARVVCLSVAVLYPDYAAVLSHRGASPAPARQPALRAILASFQVYRPFQLDCLLFSAGLAALIRRLFSVNRHVVLHLGSAGSRAQR